MIDLSMKREIESTERSKYIDMYETKHQAWEDK